MEYLKKFLFNVIINFLIILASIGLLFFVIYTISQKMVNSDSVVSKLASIDLKSFFLSLVLTSSSLILITSSVELILHLLGVKKTLISNFFLIAIKFTYAISIIVAMLVTLTAEQFDILITTLSFIGIFTFIVPKEFFNKFMK